MKEENKKTKKNVNLSGGDVSNADVVVCTAADDVNGIELHAFNLPRVHLYGKNKRKIIVGHIRTYRSQKETEKKIHCHLTLAQNLARFQPPNENATFYIARQRLHLAELNARNAALVPYEAVGAVHRDRIALGTTDFPHTDFGVSGSCEHPRWT